MRVAPYRINPKLSAEIGRRIYDERYRRDFEAKYRGKYVAIELETGVATVGDNMNDAMEKARTAVPEGWFHVIRVGPRAALTRH